MFVCFSRTGPAAQINFMGYAKPSQNGRGIHLRLRARAFIMAQVPETPPPMMGVRTGTQSISIDPEKTICFVSADIGMGSDLLTLKVVQRLEELLPKGGKRLCHLENLSIRYCKPVLFALDR
jgi:neutral ceramidase